MPTYFTSDTHFGHDKIIEYCERPFKGAWEMDRVLVERWNSVVQAGDTVYHMGDFAFGNGAFWKATRSRLNGSICLIRGNHDTQIPNGLFQWVKDYYELALEGHKAVLSHYGMRTWHHDLRGVWQLYGHSHGKLPSYGKSTDVGVDVWDFTPVSIEQLTAFMAKRPIGPHPMFDKYQPPRF